MILNREFIYGFGLGIILTSIFAYLLNQLASYFDLISVKERSLLLISICTIAFFIPFMRDSRMKERQKGMAYATICLAALWFIKFGGEIL